MNDDSNRSQLNSLKAELQRVETDLRFLRVKAEQLESRISAEEHASAQTAILERLVAPPVIQPTVVEPVQQVAQEIIPEPAVAETRSEPADLVEQPTPAAIEPPPPVPVAKKPASAPRLIVPKKKQVPIEEAKPVAELQFSDFAFVTGGNPDHPPQALITLLRGPTLGQNPDFVALSDRTQRKLDRLRSMTLEIQPERQA